MRDALVSPRDPGADTRHDVRGAWWCVASAPVALVVGFVGGQAVAAALGYTDEGLPPWWVGGAALATALLALLVPTVAAWRLHRRALARGDERAAVPAYLLLSLTVLVTALNLFSWGMRVLLE